MTGASGMWRPSSVAKRQIWPERFEGCKDERDIDRAGAPCLRASGFTQPSFHLIRSVSGSDELALFEMFARSSPEDLRMRCLGMIKDFPRLKAARLARCDRDREIALVDLRPETFAQTRAKRVAVFA
jgi:hypothetical protein